MQEMLEVRLKESKFDVNNEWMDNVVVSEQQLTTSEIFPKLHNTTIRRIPKTQQQPLQGQALQQQSQQLPPQQHQNLQAYQHGRYQSQNKNKTLYSTASQASQSFITCILTGFPIR